MKNGIAVLVPGVRLFATIPFINTITLFSSAVITLMMSVPR
ncbi:protein of unknown function [Xenorhabdus poinarii G6]|uniref:Uncharacterized protein n=1 Tax=Xenorhabdus poinarii G6 TaxID=1354304 RepID=A0A068R0R2_9GAMM|nr:protein of unknown function [Xenorhabdus poinarii G6]